MRSCPCFVMVAVVWVVVVCWRFAVVLAWGVVPRCGRRHPSGLCVDMKCCEVLWFHVGAVELGVTVLAADGARMVFEMFVATCSSVVFEACGAWVCVGIGWCCIHVVVHVVGLAILAHPFAVGSLCVEGIEVRGAVWHWRWVEARRWVETIVGIGGVGVVAAAFAIFAFDCPCFHLRDSGAVMQLKLECSLLQIGGSSEPVLRRRKEGPRSLAVSTGMAVLRAVTAVRRCDMSRGLCLSRAAIGR